MKIHKKKSHLKTNNNQCRFKPIQKKREEKLKRILKPHMLTLLTNLIYQINQLKRKKTKLNQRSELRVDHMEVKKEAKKHKNLQFIRMMIFIKWKMNQEKPNHPHLLKERNALNLILLLTHKGKIRKEIKNKHKRV